MKITNKLKFTYLISLFLLSFNLSAQVYDVNTTGRIIEGAVDGNGAPTQTLNQVLTALGQNGSVLRINASNAIIRNVIINATGQQFGIQINNGGAGATIENVVITNANENGITVNSATNVVIDKVTVSSSRRHGIFSQSSNNLVVQNSIVFNNGLQQNVSIATWVGIDDGYGVYNGDGVPIDYAGIFIDGGADVTLDGNNSYANNGHGIKLNSVSNDANADGYSAKVINNIVGLNVALDVPQGNFGEGIALLNSSKVLIDANQSVDNGNRDLWDNALGNIGLDANSGLDNENFHGAGIELFSSSNNTLTNNIIGVRLTSTGASITTAAGDSLGNHKHGIYIRNKSSNNIIGTPNNGNIVGGNGYAFQDVHTNDSDPSTNSFLFGVAHGITLHDDGGIVSNNKIQGNFVGYYKGDCIPNRQDGISLLGFYAGGSNPGNFNNTIGGTLAGEGNTIGGGMFGIFAQGPTVARITIAGNFIGTDGSTFNDISCSPKEGGVVVQNGASNFSITKNYIGYISESFPAVEVRGSSSNSVKIFDNQMKCNGDGIRLTNSGNNNFGVSPGVLAINTLESDENTVTGVTPNANDRIDVYVADSCNANSTPCQNTSLTETNAQGLRYVTTINAQANSVLVKRSEAGYFSFDLTSAIATTNGLTYKNIVLASRVFDGNTATNTNTSEFHKCIAVPLCDPPANVDITSATDFNLCKDATATVTTKITKQVGDNFPLTDFRYVLVSMPSLNEISENSTGTFVISNPGQYKVFAYNSTNKEDCGKYSDETITVNTQDPVTPAILTQTTPGDLCAGQTNVQFSVSGQVGSSYSWTISNDPTWLRTGTSVTVAQVTQNFTISVIETTAAPFSCKQEPVSLPVVVNALPVAPSITGKNDVCEGEITSYSVPLVSGMTYDWSVSATDAVVTEDNNSISVKWGATSGKINLAVTNQFGCISSSKSELNVLVNLLPLAKTISGPNPICAGTNGTYSVTGSGTGSTFSWTQNGVVLASTSSSVSIVAPEMNTFTLKVLETSAKGCVALDSSKLTVAVNSRPIPINLSAIPSPDICIGDAYQVAVDVASNVEFTWSSNPTSMITTTTKSNVLDLVGSVSGKITVSAKNTVTGCSSNSSEAKSIDITIHQLPLKPVILGKDTINCSAIEVFTIQSPNATSKYIWTYGTDAVGTPNAGDTTIVTSATVDFGPRRASVSVQEISEWGCESAIGVKDPIMIGCDPKADFTVDAPEYCLGEPVTVTEFATYTPVSIEPLRMWFLFTGADVDSAEVLPGGSVVVNYAAPGTYPISMIIQQSGKADTLDSIDVVVIKPLPTISTQTLIGNATVCQNNEGTYTIQSTNVGSKYNWSFVGASELSGSTNISKNLLFGPSAQDVTIKVIEDRNGCIDSLSQVVDVLSTPTIKSLQGVNDVCKGEAVVISLLGAPSTSKYIWTPNSNITGYNSDSTEATFVFPNAGNYEISVLETDINGCFDLDSTSKSTIRIKDIPTAPIITGSGLNGICEGATASFTSTLVDGFTYNWTVTTPDLITTNNGNSIVVTPNGTGTKTVSLSVTKEACTSAISSVNYLVEALPASPKVLPDGELFCEGQEVDFRIENPTATSTYCWEIPVGASITEGQSNCPVTQINDKITVKLGNTGGQVSAFETTALGCKSIDAGKASVSIQKALGSFTINDKFEGDICSSASYDSLAHYSVSALNSTSIFYKVTPSNGVSDSNESTNGVNRDYDVIFATPGQYKVTAIAEAGACFEDSVSWNVQVKAPQQITMSIDNREVCEDSDVTYSVSLTNNSDANAKFKWYLDGSFIGEGRSIVVDNVQLGDQLSVEYVRGNGFCVDIANSALTKLEDLLVIELPYVEGLISGSGITEKYDDFGNLFYQVVNRQDITLEGTLENNLQSGVSYAYKFDYIEQGVLSNVGIVTPVGSITDYVETEATLENVPAGVKQRKYYFTVTANSLCSAIDSMIIKLDFQPWIPNVVKPGCGCLDGVWTIDNSKEYPQMSVVFFNRWGTVVRTFAPGTFEYWDGTSDNGEQLPVGTYYWTVDFNDGVSSTCTGPVSLLR